MSRVQPQAKPTAAGQARQRRSRQLWGMLAGVVFLLPMVVVLLPTSVVLGLLMLPSMAAFLADRSIGRMLTVTIAILNAVGSIPAVIAVWARGHTLMATASVLGEPLMWFGPYLAAAFGWVVFLVMPAVVHRYYETQTGQRLRVLRERLDKLREEWGDAVAGAAAAKGGDDGDDALNDGAAG